MLEAAPGIRAVAIFEEICRRHPEVAVGVRRTLERRIARWRALNGPSRDVIFRQEHPPGTDGRICATSSSAGARDAGCAVEIDPVGNIFGRRPRTDHSLPPVAIGSHLDTQICGGQYDGVLGVMCGLEAIRTLNDRAVQTSATKPLPMIRDDHRKPLASYSAPWTARARGLLRRVTPLRGT